MTKVTFDAVANNSGELDARGWIKKTATITISGLAASDKGRDDLILRANQALKSAGYVAGAAHPSHSGLALDAAMSFKILSSGVVDVGVSYSRGLEFDAKGRCLISQSGGVSLTSEKTNTDKNGEDIVVEWRRDQQAAALKQYATADAKIAIQTKTFKLIYSHDPGATAVETAGKLSADRKILCSGFSYDKDQQNGWWNVTIEFSIHPVGWDPRIVYVMENGLPPANFDASYNRGKTVKVVQVLKEGDFGALGLPL